ncbi:hypothetical protein [Lutibacter sp.]
MKKKDLHKVAPKLSEISLKKSGFEIPSTYFETIEDGVIATLNAEKFSFIKPKESFQTPKNYFNSIEDIVITKLKAEALNTKNSNTIPENYFETLENKVISEIKTTPKVISLKSRFIKFAAPIAIAASLLLIFILNNTSTNVTFASLSSSEIENWIDNGSIDIDALTIASLYPEIELNDEIYSDSLSNEEVLEYLYQENLENILYEN